MGLPCRSHVCRRRDNDLSALAIVGHSIAMANASHCSTQVCCPNRRHVDAEGFARRWRWRSSLAIDCFEDRSRCHDPRLDSQRRDFAARSPLLTPAMYQGWRPREELRRRASRLGRNSACVAGREPIHGAAKKTSMFFTPPQAEFRPNAPWRNEDIFKEWAQGRVLVRDVVKVRARALNNVRHKTPWRSEVYYVGSVSAQSVQRPFETDGIVGSLANPNLELKIHGQ